MEMAVRPLTTDKHGNGSEAKDGENGNEAYLSVGRHGVTGNSFIDGKRFKPAHTASDRL